MAGAHQDAFGSLLKCRTMLKPQLGYPIGGELDSVSGLDWRNLHNVPRTPVKPRHACQGASPTRCYLCRDSLSKDVVFFFQAEDGIRDYKVTGVQTCALPI